MAQHCITGTRRLAVSHEHTHANTKHFFLIFTNIDTTINIETDTNSRQSPKNNKSASLHKIKLSHVSHKHRKNITITRIKNHLSTYYVSMPACHRISFPDNFRIDDRRIFSRLIIVPVK